MKVQTLTREFKIGALSIPDPSPTTAPESIVPILAQTYPHIKGGAIGREVEEGNKIIYEIDIPPAKTNG